MMADVEIYDSLGEHRTATETDHATSHWLMRRMDESGLASSLQSFSTPLFVNHACRIEAGGETFAAFPGWPVSTTPADGISARLAPSDAGDLSGRIAVVRLARAPGGGWTAPGVGDRVLQLAQRGPLAVVAITENATGEVVALNTDSARFAAPFQWPVPVALVGSRDGARLQALAVSGEPSRLVLIGDHFPNAQAANIVGRRRGKGPMILVSTPKTGWFHCAGERGTGIAVFLELARRLVSRTAADLTFVAFAGHELDWLGARRFQSEGAPPPERVRAWLHIGADAAMQPIGVRDGVPSPARAAGPQRRVAAGPAVIPIAATAFTPEAGYAPAQPLVEANAGGELSVFRADYPMLAGIIGANPLFHTRLDRAAIATTPAELATVAAACSAFLSGLSGAR